MLSRFVTVVILLPIAVVLIALAVANREAVLVTIDPFNPGNPGLSTTVPLFVVIFTSLIAGLLIGSVTTWWKQGRYRKIARQRPADSAPAATAAGRDTMQARPALAAPGR